ncbi:MAG: hypothetical protein U1C33_02655, partial [Candidatus Cloacimonadaceae bacterium]|nr:hypothetical protein [Candidatus Cloacimonadaceae bacterium]
MRQLWIWQRVGLFVFVFLLSGQYLRAVDAPFSFDLRFGLVRNTIQTEGKPEYDYLKYDRIDGTMGLGIGFLLNDNLELHSFPHLRSRSYKGNTRYHELTTRALFLDVPLTLRTKLYGLELGAGPNLAIELDTKYGGNALNVYGDSVKDVPDLIPGYVVSATYRAVGMPQVFLHLFYRWDLLPLSESWGYKKIHEGGGLCLGYTFLQGDALIDLLPDYTFSSAKSGIGWQAGVYRTFINEHEIDMPYIKGEQIG